MSDTGPCTPEHDSAAWTLITGLVQLVLSVHLSLAGMQKPDIEYLPVSCQNDLKKIILPKQLCNFAFSGTYFGDYESAVSLLTFLWRTKS